MKADVNSVLNGANNDNFVTPYTLKMWGSKNKSVAVGPNEPTNGQDVWFKESRNFFDKAQTAPGFVSDGNGTVNTDPNVAKNRRYTLNYIKVIGGEKYYLTNVGNSRWGAWYDENKTFIKGIAGYGSLVAPSNAKYVRFTVLSDYLDTYMFNIGNEIPFEAYGSKEILTFNGTGYDKFSIIESGENGRGYYIKYYDGTLIQYAQRGHSFGSLSKYPNIEWWHEEEFFDTFPIPFKDLNYDAYVNFAEKPNNPIFISFIRNDSTERLEFGVVTPIKFSQSITFNWFAIGRWK